MPSLSLLVLRANDLERTRAFYEALGLVFTREQHGSGPVHYARALGDVVLELYPRREPAVDDTRIGLRVANLGAALAAVGGAVRGEATVVDPDGRFVDLAASE